MKAEVVARIGEAAANPLSSDLIVLRNVVGDVFESQSRAERPNDLTHYAALRRDFAGVVEAPRRFAAFRAMTLSVEAITSSVV